MSVPNQEDKLGYVLWAAVGAVVLVTGFAAWRIVAWAVG